MVWELSETYGLVALSLIFPFSFSWLFFLFGLLVMKLHLIYEISELCLLAMFFISYNQVLCSPSSSTHLFINV